MVAEDVRTVDKEVNMAINLTLHEDDYREFFRIRRELVGWHHCTGTTQVRMATLLGVSDKFVHELETGRSMPRLSSLQLWASAFDLRVQPVVSRSGLDLGHPVPPMLEGENLMLWNMARPFDAARWVRLWVVSDLIMLRHALGVSPPEMADRLNVKLSSLYSWERTSHDPIVSKLFTYARALGSSVTFALMERRDYQYE